jgi:hypothetical protein
VNDSVAAARLATSSNVYYLPAPMAAAEPAPLPSRLARVSRTWWRLRFALAGIRLALRPAPTPLFAEDDMFAALQGDAELIERRPRPMGPGRVIDFDAARARLRPAPAN